MGNRKKYQKIIGFGGAFTEAAAFNFYRLPKSVQEISILISASLVKSKIFIPPFNKWNKDTEEICDEHGIELVKFEDGWLSMEHNNFSDIHNKWYLHAREFEYDDFVKWFGNV